MTRSIAELRNSGVIFQPDEAVAIAQQLIAATRESGAPDEAAPPFGPPSVDNVFLSDDGSVICRGCTATPAVSEIGIFLESLLGAGSPRVHGGLRYTVARALLNVDVPPFDSLDAFSQDLARHEQGNRASLIRWALRRAGQALRPGSGQSPSVVLTVADRRRTAPASASELRRALREADARLFAQQHLLPQPQVIDLPLSPPPVRDRSFIAAAACVAAGLALVGTGHFMDSPRAAIDATPATPAPVALPAVARVDSPDRATPAPSSFSTQLTAGPSTGLRAPERGIIRVRAAARPAPRSKAAKRVKQPVGAAPARQERGVIDRLKLGWLRRAFTVKSAL